MRGHSSNYEERGAEKGKGRERERERERGDTRMREHTRSYLPWVSKAIVRETALESSVEGVCEQKESVGLGKTVTNVCVSACRGGEGEQQSKEE